MHVHLEKVLISTKVCLTSISPGLQSSLWFILKSLLLAKSQSIKHSVNIFLGINTISFCRLNATTDLLYICVFFIDYTYSTKSNLFKSIKLRLCLLRHNVQCSRTRRGTPIV